MEIFCFRPELKRLAEPNLPGYAGLPPDRITEEEVKLTLPPPYPPPVEQLLKFLVPQVLPTLPFPNLVLNAWLIVDSYSLRRAEADVIGD